MKKEISRKSRRFGVVINYIALILLNIFYEMIKRTDATEISTTGAITSFILILITFIIYYYRTHIWHFIHAKIEELDEREILVIHNSLRYAYGVFAVIALVIIYLYSLSEGRVSLILAISMIYFAHILPASIIAWKEKEV